MKFFKLKIIKNNWTKLLSVFFFVLLFSSYIYTFAIGQPYAPGTTLDPSCAPGETNCTVLVIPDQSANIGKFLTTDGTGTFWDSITESDPVFTASSASGITNTDISTWNAKQDALGFIPYDSTNPSNYISGITSGDVTTALGFNPYDSTNPDGYISAINSGMVTTALGFTPLASESDPVFLASTAHGITGTDITNWNAKQNALTNPITGTGTSGQVSFWNGTGTQTGDSGLFWDDTNKRLGVGTNTPSQKLEVAGNVNVSSGSAYMYNGSEVIKAQTALDNYFFGNSGNLTMTGTENTANGYLSLALNTTGYGNTAIGHKSLIANTTGLYNVANGAYSLYKNTIGTENTANGVASLQENVSGIQNTASGTYASYANTTGSYNTSSGYQTLFYNTTGSYNTSVGAYSLYDLNIVNGTGRNTAIGENTGRGIVTGINNTIIGASVTGLASGLSNNIILANGTGAIKAQHDGTNWSFVGSVGIGTTTPGYKLDVQGGQINASGGLCIAGVCQTSWIPLTPWTVSGNNIYNNNSGNVGIGTTNPTSLLQLVGTSSNQFRLGYDSTNYSTLGVAVDGGLTLSTNGTTPNYSINLGSGGNFSLNNGGLFYGSTNHNFAINNSSSINQFEVAVPAAPGDSIPLMTSYTTPSGIASASTEYPAGSYPAYLAFDNNTNTQYIDGGFVSPTWLSYQFISPKIIVKYRIYPRALVLSNAPNTWTFEGWDGTSWITLDTKVGVVMSASWYDYPISNTTPYIKYRINVTAINGSANLSIAELEMWESSSYNTAFAVGTTGNVGITQAPSTSGSPTALTVTPGAHTNLTLSTEATDINFNLARNVQFATGALTTQRAMRIQAPTYGFVGASTITDASTLDISGAPIKGTNASITNTYALKIGSNAVSTATNSYGLYVNAQTGATNNYGAVFATGNVGIGTTTPSYKLDVQGGQINASGGLCIAGVCQASWPTPGFTLPSLTSGSILFSNGTTISQDNSNFFWDNTNKRLGLGTTTPSADLSFGTGNRTIQIDPKSYGAGSNLYINAQTTAGGGSPFTAQSVGTRAWTGVSVNPTNGDVWVIVQGGDIYKSAGGTGPFVAQSAGFRNWYGGISVNSVTGDVWATANVEDIYKSAGGIGPFVAQSAGARFWRGISVNSVTGDVWATVYGAGDIYKSAGGTGPFVAQSAGIRSWYGVSINPITGDVWAVVDGGDIYKSAGGTGLFVAQSAGNRGWYGVSVNPTTGDVWAVVFNGDIYKNTSGTGSFIAQSAGTKNWAGISVNSASGDVWSVVYPGDIYKQTVGINQSGGNLLLSSGSGTGNSPNYLSFTTSTPTVSGSTQQTLSEKMRILGDGNIGINTTTPGYKLDVQGGQINASGGLCIAGVCQTSWSQVPDYIDFNNTDFNTKVGYQAGKNIVAGAQYNTFLGYQAGLSSLAGSTNAADYNTAVGYGSLFSNTTGFRNTANGVYSLNLNTTGNYNVANGMYSLYANTTGINNTGNGYGSLYANSGGSQNTANGSQALYYNTNGSNNTASGMYSLYNNTTGSNNTGSGYGSMFNNTTGYQNVAIGVSSLYTNSIGTNNVALGYSAGRYETGSNSFYVDNQDRLNTAGDKAGALLYGTFNANPLLQTLTVNGNLGVGAITPSAKLDVLSNSGKALSVTQAISSYDSGNPFISLNYGSTNIYRQYMEANWDVTSEVLQHGTDLSRYMIKTNGDYRLTINNMGNVGIGTTSPTALLHLKAGSATASTAPLKFTPGPLLTTTEAGAIEFLGDDYYATVSTGAGSLYYTDYPPGQGDLYVKATSVYGGIYYPYLSTDPTKPLTGSGITSWISSTPTNQRFHIDLGSAKTITRIYYENWHWAGSNLDRGARDFTFWGSNDPSAFADLVYGDDANWTQITTASSQFAQHVALDVVDPQYITVTNFTPYRYYAIKIANNWGSSNYIGFRRIELQEGGGGFTARKGLVLTDGNNLVSTRIPFSTTNGRLIDSSTFVFDNTNNRLGLGLSSPSYKLEVKDNTASYTTKIWNDGDSASNSGLLIQAGLYDQSLIATSTLIGFNDGDGTPVGSITFGSNATSYNTASDERLKENIGDTTLSLDTLNQIKIHDFSWKSDSNHNIYHGVLAQELQLIYPQAVMVPTNPDDSWMVDYSKLTPLIVKSIQDLDLRVKGIESLITPDSSVGSSIKDLIKNFLEEAGNRIEVVFFGEVHMKRLCIDDLCIDRSQLGELLNKNNISTGGVAPVVNTEQPEVTPAPTPDPTQPEESPVTPTEPTPTPEVPPTIETPVVEPTPTPIEPPVENSQPVVETTPIVEVSEVITQ